MIRRICTTWRMMPVARAGKALALPVGPKRYLPSPWHLAGPFVGLSACSLARHSSICAEQHLTVRLLMSGLQRCQQRVCSAVTGLLGFLAVPNLKWLVASR